MYLPNLEGQLTKRGLPLIKQDEKQDDSISKEQKLHALNMADVKLNADIEERRWQSCCFQLEPESSLFFAKLTVSILVIGLCSFQLVNLKDCQFQSLYSSLLSSVITHWLIKK